jgi:predicted Zn finger-like uncharacterized protein
LTDSDLRYTFSCPSCAGSFSLSLAKIPPVRARLGCPKCGTLMDFPSREEARVYISLQAGSPTPEEEPAAPEPPPAPVKPRPAVAPPAAPPVEPSAAAEKLYRVEEKGYENEAYDRRAMRTLIRTQGLVESHMVRFGEDEPRRAAEFPELKSLFELAKTSRNQAPAVCRRHTDQLAFYTCKDTGRPICEGCATEKKFGGTSIRVCEHCGGTVDELVRES